MLEVPAESDNDIKVSPFPAIFCFFQLILLMFAMWSVQFGRFTLGSLQETMSADLGFSDNQMALLQGMAVAVPLALFAVPFSIAFERYSRSRLVFLLCLINLIAGLITAFSSDFYILFLARVLVGVALAGLPVGVYSMVSDFYPAHQRGRANMLVIMGETIAMPMGFALGGLLLGMGGVVAGIMLVPSLEAWRLSQLWMCLLMAPIALCLLVVRDPPRPGTIAKQPPFKEVWPEFWAFRYMIIPLLMARVMVWTADTAVLVWGAPTFSRNYHLPPEQVGSIMGTLLLVGGLLGPILAGPLADFCQRTGGPRRTVIAMAVLAALSAPASLFGIMPTAFLAAVGLGIFLTFGFAISTMALTLSNVVVPSRLRGLSLGVALIFGGIVSLGIAPLVASSLASLLGGKEKIGLSLAIICVVTSILGAIIFLLSRGRFAGKPVSDAPEIHSIDPGGIIEGQPSYR